MKTVALPKAICMGDVCRDVKIMLGSQSASTSLRVRIMAGGQAVGFSPYSEHKARLSGSPLVST